MICHYFARVGGWRLCVLYQTGRKWAYLVETGSLDKHRVPLSEVPHLKPCTIRPDRLAKRLRKRAAWFEYMGVQFPAAAVKQAVASLKEGAAS